MTRCFAPSCWLAVLLGGSLLIALAHNGRADDDPAAPPTAADVGHRYAEKVRPLMQRLCLECHSTEKKKGELDLQRFASIDDARKDLKPWTSLVEMVDAAEMPPKDKPQPTAEERRELLAWTRDFIDVEARARAGDPGPTLIRRLNNTEYNNTIRDLTGIDLQPANQFPLDGAAGEGFTNAAGALSDIAPPLLQKYLAAAQDVAAHAVLLPDGFRFSTGKTRNDWTNEILAQIRTFYRDFADDAGKPFLDRYLLATIRHRAALQSGQETVATVAAQEKLSPKYLQKLWEALNQKEPNFPLERLQGRWRAATDKDVGGLLAEVGIWQHAFWRMVPIGSYRDNLLERLQPNVSAIGAQHQLRKKIQPAPGQTDVVLYLVAATFPHERAADLVVWRRPRLEKKDTPTVLLKDYPDAAAKYEPGSKSTAPDGKFGISSDRFGKHPAGQPADDASLVAPANEIIEIHLPLAFKDYDFVVEGEAADPSLERIVQLQLSDRRPPADPPWDDHSPIVARADSQTLHHLLAGYQEYRELFPQLVCYPHIIPTDEVVCLKHFHRDDAWLVRDFLNEEQANRLNRIWAEQRFVSQWPRTENEYLPLFIGFVTQDQPVELQKFYEGFREPFKKRAEQFDQEVAAAIPAQFAQLLDFAERAYRRPLSDLDKDKLRGLFEKLQAQGLPADEAFRGVLARVLISPSFLFRIEHAPPGPEPQPISDWELASRLSYFLWSTTPDAELRKLAAAGQLHEPSVLQAQTERMLKDAKVRASAIEFGTQWMQVRGFNELKEKNESLFPAFNDQLRAAIYEESILFFQDLFQHDGSLRTLLDSDATYLNDTLAQHYGIPNVAGNQWRRVEGIHPYGRGGILGLASFQTKESGASRTSPILRGNWVVETLLGEKLPRPPPNVPKLPDDEKSNDGLTLRQIVAKHTSDAACAVCHQRIDPFGFALENYDAIGRKRDKDAGGLAIDAKVRLRDGTEFAGLDGLRTYLLTKKRDVVGRLFCRRLLGYALGRACILSDQPLIDAMKNEFNPDDGHLSRAILRIVQSPQFRLIRGNEFPPDRE
ncbi:MAG TPA: DUF1592 domain-containing protein [Pirellulales bacterium]|nr:DUF1592 domain-containing protein [Pirellulales bacterium]